MLNYAILQVWRNEHKEKRLSAVYEYILDILNLHESENMKNSIWKSAKFLCLEIQKKWDKCNRTYNKFLIKHKAWLDKDIKLDANVVQYLRNNQAGSSKKQRGRPQKPFKEAALITKKRRVIDLVTTRTCDELAFAAQLSHRQSNKNSRENKKSLSPLRALALYLDLGLTFRKYNILRSTMNNLNPNMLPSYYSLKKIESQCLPKIQDVSDIHAEINLQEILDKTVESLIGLVKDNISQFSCLTLICKWGFDGSSGHSIYKQKFFHSSNTDEFMFLIAFVPIRLMDTVLGSIIWENPRPSSTLYCRPIKFIFTKETPSLIKDEQTRIEQSIKNLKHSTVQFDSNSLQVSHKMLFTMIDGSVCNVISGTNSTQTCYICGATPKEMNRVIENRLPNESVYRYGLSTLHAWIRSFECLLHIAYRLPLKTWQVRGDNAKKVLAATKSDIQQKFKKNMGLIVDKPKSGFGSTNDGNTARRFFEKPELSAAITGLNVSLIKNIGIILKVISSSRQINVATFTILVKETKEIYLAHYSWYYMPMSLHKLLVHGPDIISSFIMPIGKLSEEALEARHKDIRHFREHHTRKTSRVDTNKDLMKMLLLSSDPQLSSLRKSKSDKKIKLDRNILEYFVTDDNEDGSLLLSDRQTDLDADVTSSESDND